MCRLALIGLGILLLIAGLFGLLLTFSFASLAAWELPAILLLCAALVIVIFGLAILSLGITARLRRQARRRLVKSLFLLCSLSLGMFLTNFVLGRLAPDEAQFRKSPDPTCDCAPFHAAVPLCETDPAADPLEAHYPANRTLRHCTDDFDVIVHTDELGLRSIDCGPAEPLTLAIGDSFCFGWGVKDDEAYPAVLGWLNAGLWGRPPASHIKALQWWLPRLRPRRIVWEIYPPHLITQLPDNWLSSYQYPQLRDGLPRDLLDWYHATGLGRFLHQRFGFAINRGNYFTKEAMLYREPTPELSRVYDAVEQYFVLARQLAADADVEVWFAIVPSKRMLALYDDNPARASIPIRRLSVRLQAAGFNADHIINLLPTFAESPDRRDLYFPHDAHWTPLGHRRAAEVINRAVSAYRPDEIIRAAE